MAEKGTRKNTGKKKTAQRGRPKKKPAAVSRRDILTEKQEAFLYYLVYEGLSQREAYRKSHPDCTQKDAYVDSKASNELKKDKVRARYEELINEFKEKALYTREQADKDFEWIKQISKMDIEENGLRQANSTAYINAIKGRCDLNDLWPTKKQDIVLNGNMEVNNPFEGLTTEELKLLAVRCNGMALEFIKDATYELQKEAIKQKGFAIQFVTNPSEELKMLAVEQDPFVILKFENPSIALQLAAFEKCRFIIDHIENPSEELIKENEKHKEELEEIRKEFKFMF